MGRLIISALLALGLSGAAASGALACSPLPSPDWEGWVETPTTDIFAGQVTSVTRLPPAVVNGIRLGQARLRITRLVSYENRAGLAALDATVVLQVLDRGREADAHAACNYPTPYSEGDVLLVMQAPGAAPRLFSRAWVAESRFAPLFQQSQSGD